VLGIEHLAMSGLPVLIVPTQPELTRMPMIYINKLLKSNVISNCREVSTNVRNKDNRVNQLIVTEAPTRSIVLLLASFSVSRLRIYRILTSVFPALFHLRLVHAQFPQQAAEVKLASRHLTASVHQMIRRRCFGHEQSSKNFTVDLLLAVFC
jgi:hypothetical protein